ncbi:hypothetical protein P7C70_g7296, partial [Phenoliferia sp. Uapishka_3]
MRVHSTAAAATALLYSFATLQLSLAYPTISNILEDPTALLLSSPITPNATITLVKSEVRRDVVLQPKYSDPAHYRRLAKPPILITTYEESDPTSVLAKIRRFIVSRAVKVNPKYIPNPKKSTPVVVAAAPVKPTGCFPGSGLEVPSTMATASSLSQWWCPHSTEYAFMGFSYDQTPCQSGEQLAADFLKMKKTFNARYVRLYGTCDSDSNYNDNLVNAAANAKIGIYALIWFGFDGDDLWKGRMARLVKTIKTNPKAPYVIRNIAVGSEPLFDGVLSPSDLAGQVNSLRATLSQYGIQTSISEMPYGYQSNGDAPQIFKAIDIVEGHVLPFFDGAATTGGNACSYLHTPSSTSLHFLTFSTRPGGVVQWSIQYFQSHGLGKPIRLTQTGWPSNTNIWGSNNGYATASVSSEAAYFKLLDQHCSDMKNWGVGWFSQIWDDNQLDGWGVLDYNDNAKFPFAPKTSC